MAVPLINSPSASSPAFDKAGITISNSRANISSVNRAISKTFTKKDNDLGEGMK
jgi:hypothetical protein